MNAIEIKSDLVRIINKLNDFELLQAIHTILVTKTKNENVDYWDNLPIEIQNEIDQAIKEADRGELIPHEEVMREVKKKYKINV